MQFDGSFGAPEFGPVEQRHRQVDDAPVQAHQLVLEAELLPPALTGHPLLAFSEQLGEHRLEQFPRPMLVGVGQGRLLRRQRNAQMPQLASAAGQPAADLAQRVGAPELAEQHGYELTTAREAAGGSCEANLDKSVEK
jgi:hypothetical protein